MRSVTGMHDPRADIGVLVAASVTLLGCAYVLYARRDL
jgi:hypothetical protein